MSQKTWPFFVHLTSLCPLAAESAGILLACTTLHCTTLHYTTLHYMTLHYITLHYITLQYMGGVAVENWSFPEANPLPQSVARNRPNKTKIMNLSNLSQFQDFLCKYMAE